MDKTLSNLKRVEGQVSAVRKMYEEGRDCLDVVQQIIAARSALASIGKSVLAGEASRCATAKKPEDFDRILKSLVEMS